MRTRRLICELCSSGADYLGADHSAERPTWQTRCTAHYDEEYLPGYWMSVDEFWSRDPAWWLLHIDGKDWGARSDFRWLVGALIGYVCGDDRRVA